MKQSNHFSAPILTVIFLLLFFLGSTVAAPETPEGNKSKPPPTIQVTVQNVIKATSRSQIEVVGTVQAVQRAVIAAKISGSITEMPVVLGSKVNKGDLLVTISAGEISSRVLQAQAQLQQAKRNLEREKKLLLQKAGTTETVKSLEDILRVNQAAFQEAKTMLEYTKITAPFEGLITDKPANAGDLATPGVPLLYLENNDRLQVVAPIPEALVLGIKRGDSLVVHIPAAEVELSGTVAEVSPSTDPLSRTSPVKIDIEKRDKLRPGQFARVRLTNKPMDAFYVPLKAVIRHGQMEKVFMLDNNRARLRLVRTGTRQGDLVEVLAGIDADEIVIVENNSHLVDGQPVSVR